LKAIGYPDRSLIATVSAMSLLIVVAGFVPALAAASVSILSFGTRHCCL